MSAARETTSPGPSSNDVQIDAGSLSVAAGSVTQLGELLPGDWVLVLAMCEPSGTPTDLVLRDRQGRLAVVAGVSEDRRLDLAEVLSLAGGVLETESQPPSGVARLGEDLYRTIVEESPQPLMLLDRDGAVVYVSPSVPYELGWGKAELVGHKLVDFLHPDDRERTARMTTTAAAAHRLGTVMTLRWRRRHTGYVAVEAAIRRVVGEDGAELEGVVIALRTNSFQWSGVGEMLLARERERALADGSDCGMAIVSGNERTLGAVLDANVPLGRMVGITRGQLAGLSLASLIADQDAGRVRDALQAVAAEGGTVSLEVTVVPRLGRQRLVTLRVTASPLADYSGKELVVRLQDTTEHAGLVAELSRTVERLERSNEELAGLARITAHDLSAPLRAVSGLIDLLPQADASPDTRLTFDGIRSAIDRMQAMVAGITGYVLTRSEDPTRAIVDLGELVARVRETLASEIEARGATLSAEELPSVFGDEHQLERVFLNLVANALKYSTDNLPEITIYAHRVPEAWRISVADRGIGVQEADRERIFELFARGGVESGSGIGLATCRRIVELHGGRIWVEPNEPTGSIFHFTLPDEPTLAGA